MADAKQNDDKYVIKEVSDNPADFLTGPRGGEANRTHGGTTQDGNLQVLAATGPEDSAEK